MSNENDPINEQEDQLSQEPKQNEEITESSQESEQPQEPIKDENLDKAKKFGYLTKEEYVKKHGTEEGFKSPEQFNKFGESFNEFKDILTGMKSKLDKRDKEIEALVKANENVRLREQEAARQELLRALQQAKDNGDIEKVSQITKIQARQEFEEQQRQNMVGQDDSTRALNSFHERNKHWYNEQHPELVERAKQLDQELRTGTYQLRHKLNIPLAVNYHQLGEQIEAAMAAEFPDIVGKPINRPAPALSSSSSNVNKSAQIAGSSNAAKAFNNLSEAHKFQYSATKRVAEAAARGRGDKDYKYTYEKFIKKLKEDGEI